MSAEDRLAAIDNVEIEEGTIYKYVLINVTASRPGSVICRINLSSHTAFLPWRWR